MLPRHLGFIVVVLACHRVTTVSAEHPASLIQPRGYWYWDSYGADTVRLLAGDSTAIEVFWTASRTDLLTPGEPPGKKVSPRWSTENSSVAGVRAAEECTERLDVALPILCVSVQPSWRAVVAGRRPGITRIRVRVRDTTLVRPVRVIAP